MRKTNFAICFDMDGTIADLYGVENWLDYLINGDPTPYAIAKPMINMSALAKQLNRIQKLGYEINIISWLAKGGTVEYDELVTNAKLNWLTKHLPSVKFDNINIVPYGTPKSNFGYDLLFDDEERNRLEWKGDAYDADNILGILREI